MLSLFSHFGGTKISIYKIFHRWTFQEIEVKLLKWFQIDVNIGQSSAKIL